MQCNYLKYFVVHKHECNGETIELGFDSEELLVNHYTIQSLNFYMNVKCTRGNATNLDKCCDKRVVKKFARNRNRFNVIDTLCKITDKRLLDQNKEFIVIKNYYKKLL